LLEPRARADDRMRPHDRARADLSPCCDDGERTDVHGSIDAGARRDHGARMDTGGRTLARIEKRGDTGVGGAGILGDERRDRTGIRMVPAEHDGGGSRAVELRAQARVGEKGDGAPVRVAEARDTVNLDRGVPAQLATEAHCELAERDRHAPLPAGRAGETGAPLFAAAGWLVRARSGAAARRGRRRARGILQALENRAGQVYRGSRVDHISSEHDVEALSLRISLHLLDQCLLQARELLVLALIEVVLQLALLGLNVAVRIAQILLFAVALLVGHRRRVALKLVGPRLQRFLLLRERLPAGPELFVQRVLDR